LYFSLADNVNFQFEDALIYFFTMASGKPLNTQLLNRPGKAAGDICIKTCSTHLIIVSLRGDSDDFSCLCTGKIDKLLLDDKMYNRL
jgi:hypothetical protein